MPTDTNLSQAYISNMARVDDFKSLLSSIRQARANYIAAIQALMKDIDDLKASHAQMLNDFKVKVLQMYPEYQGQHLGRIISSLNPNHPLYQLWVTYMQSLNDVRNAMASKIMSLQDYSSREFSAEDQEAQTLSDYQAFASQATTAVPSVDQIQANLAAVSVIPEVDQTSVIASLPAIEELDPEAASDVTLQIAQAMENSPPVDLAASVQAAPVVTTAPAVVPPSSLMARLTTLKNTQPAVFYGGAAIILMLMFGGKK